MPFAQKSKRILATLSMVAIATLGPKAARATVGGVTLSMNYGQDAIAANDNNNIVIGTGYSPTADGAGHYLSGATAQTVSQTVTTTITMQVGDYLSLAIDAVLTGNSNPSGGLINPKNGNLTQPSFLGLSEFGMSVSSTDASAAILTPIPSPFDVAGEPDTTINGVPAYTSSAIINTVSGPNGGAYNVVPAWNSISGAGDVYPNEPGFSDPGHNSGGVGINAFIVGGNTSDSADTPTAIDSLEQFAASDNVANYSNSTDFFNSLIYQALKVGTVTLTPFVESDTTEYWVNTSANPTSTSTAFTYSVTDGFPGTINNVPSLVIDVTAAPEPASLTLLGVGSATLLTRRNKKA